MPVTKMFCGFTVIVHGLDTIPLPSCAVAVIVVVPAALAVTTPPLTVATLILLELHVTFLLVAVEGETVAVNVVESPTLRVVLAGFTAMLVTVSALTVTEQY